VAVGPGEALIGASSNGVSNNGMLNVTSAAVSSITVTPATATVGYGNQQQFTAIATFSDKSTQDVTNLASWTSYPPFITSNSGLAIGEGFYPGQATGTNSISATFGGVSSSTINLTVNLTNLVSIAISPANPSIANRTAITFSVIGTFSDGSTRDVTSLAENWLLADPSIASISGIDSIVTAKAAGSTGISASVGALNVSTTLNVTSAQLQSLTLLPVNATIAPATNMDFTAIGTFSDSTMQVLTSGITWSASNPAAASVTLKGEATGVGQGTTTITATSSSQLGSIQASTPLNVSAATLNSVTVTPATAEIAPAGIFDFSATGNFSDGSTQDVTGMASWSSNTVTVASFATASAPAVTGQGIGQTTITAKVSGISGTGSLAVASPTQITLATSPSTVQIANQTAAQLTVTGTFADGTTQDLTSVVNWTSSAPSVATVEYQTGVVSSLSSGSSTITATLGSATATVQLTVTNATLTSINISPANPGISAGGSQQFTAVGNFSDGTSQTLVGVDWSSSNAAVAFIYSSGLASATGPGSAMVSASLNGVSGTTGVSVP
jgi:trimeric autotransporter adhesin